MKPGPPQLALIGAAALFAASVAAAQDQAPFAQPPYKNLKVLPHDIARPQLISTMKLFAQSLGVRCSYCHVGEEGKPLSTFDFASDAKDKKLIARKMLAMTHRINEQDFDVHDFSQVKVTCFTCHRGATKPAAFPPADAPTAPPKPERGTS